MKIISPDLVHILYCPCLNTTPLPHPVFYILTFVVQYHSPSSGIGCWSLMWSLGSANLHLSPLWLYLETPSSSSIPSKSYNCWVKQASEMRFKLNKLHLNMTFNHMKQHLKLTEEAPASSSRLSTLLGLALCCARPKL